MTVAEPVGDDKSPSASKNFRAKSGGGATYNLVGISKRLEWCSQSDCSRTRRGIRNLHRPFFASDRIYGADSKEVTMGGTALVKAADGQMEARPQPAKQIVSRFLTALAMVVTRVVVRVDVVELKRRLTVDLHDGLAASHGVVVHVGVQEGERAGNESVHSVGFELVAHTQLERSRDYRDILPQRVEMGSDPVAVGHLQTHGVFTARSAGIAFEHGKLGARIQEWRSRAEGHLIGSEAVPRRPAGCCGSQSGRPLDEQYGPVNHRSQRQSQ